MNPKISYLSAVFSLLLFCECAASGTTPSPKVHNGTLDLTAWHFEKNGPVRLDGTWLFSWKKFTDAGGIQKEDPNIVIIDLPGVWQGYTRDGEPITPYGYGTFMCTIRLDQSYCNQSMAIKLPSIGSTYVLFVNGKEIARVGKPGIDAESTKGPRYHPQIANFIPTDQTLQVTVQVANFHQAYSGLFYSLYIGRVADITRLRERNIAIDLFMVGAFLIIGLYHLGFKVLRRHENLPLVFSIFCLLLAVRVLALGNETILTDWLPSLSLDMIQKLNFISFYASIPLIFLFLWLSFPDEFKRWVLLLILITNVPFGLLVLITPAAIFTRTLELYQTICLIEMPIFVTVLTIAIIRKREGAVIIATGLFIMLILSLQDILYTKQIVNTAYLIPFGLMAFIFSQSILLSHRFAKSFTAIENLSSQLDEKNKELYDINAHLEKKVDERTMELQNAYTEIRQINQVLNTAKDQLWGEMQLAKKIQTVLIPEQPSVPGYDIAAYMVTTSEVGGDYYDVINSEDRDWVIIGDVSGHGVSAGLIMMMVQSIIRGTINAKPGASADELLTTVNGSLNYNITKMGGDKFMTIMAFSFSHDGTIHYSGHHDHPLVYRSVTGTIEILQPSGMILSPWALWKTKPDNTLRFGQGDVLLLYTDGLTEARKKNAPSSDIFGMERLADVFSEAANQGPQEIIDEIMKVIGDYTINDDISLVVMKKQ